MVQGPGTTENTLIEILVTRGRDEIDAIKREYATLYGRSLEEDIVGDTSGDFQRIFMSLIANGRDQGTQVDEAKAIEDAQMLVKAGWKQLFTSKPEFHAILFTQSVAQLSRVFVEFKRITGMSVQDTIEKEMVAGDALDGYLAFINAMQYRSRFFANQLHNAIKGLGTRDADLIRVIVSRAEIDLMAIADAYKSDFKKSLRDAIEGDTSGPYLKCLVAIVDGNYRY